MDKEELLQRADEHTFAAGLDDSGGQLGLANMRYGLAKILWAKEMVGLPPNRVFVAAPDLTVTRNGNRWRGGLGYGGKSAWCEAQLHMLAAARRFATLGDMSQRIADRQDVCLALRGHGSQPPQ